MEWLKSSYQFLWTVVRKFFIIIPLLFFIIFDLLRLLNLVHTDIPIEIIWLILFTGFVLASIASYHDLRLKLDKYESLPVRLKGLVAEGDRIVTLDNQCIGCNITKMLQLWSISIRKLIEKHYPDRKSELEGILEILKTDKALKEPLIKPVQEWLTNLRDELVP